MLEALFEKRYGENLVSSDADFAQEAERLLMSLYPWQRRRIDFDELVIQLRKWTWDQWERYGEYGEC